MIHQVGLGEKHLLIPAFEGQIQDDLCEIEASLAYIMSYRTARVIKTDSALERKEGIEQWVGGGEKDRKAGR